MQRSDGRPPVAHSDFRYGDAMANKTDRRPRHRGELGKNILVEPLNPGATLLDKVMQYGGKVAIAHKRKLRLLLDSYSISPNDHDKWERLSMALAMEYVPGFKLTTKRKGAPEKWTPALRLKLFNDVSSTKKSIMGKRSGARPTDIAVLNLILARADGIYPAKGRDRNSQVRNLGNILSKERSRIRDSKL